MFKRSIPLPPQLSETLLLWGPRQVGKSTLLKQRYPNAEWVDLLKADVYRRFVQQPEVLRQQLRASGAKQIVIDEIQKVPALLDEVHWLHENMDCRFALCGSSARKVKRGHANLLGGRAIRFELFGLTAAELGSQFELDRILNHGTLPRIYQSSNPQRLLRAYVGDYLKEEVAAEGLSRNLQVFSEFLNISALSDTDLINFSSIARDCGVSSHTVKGYFSILEDTLLGHWLPAYRRKPKRRVIGAPKFFFADVGVVNVLAQRSKVLPGSDRYGKAFENWIFHELRAHTSYSERDARLSYWRLASGIEVDFIVNDMQLAIEAKASPRITSDHLKGLRNLKQDHPRLPRRIVVCLESKKRTTDDGIEILPVKAFLKQLGDGLLF